uniref:Protein kinase n=1 Tax=Trypanosoma congolense (strain IL3000) TaxID=1068625 RepID=G0UVZ6_TRYCI|nr:putative protein kinase [Trypanosoma congolense IL3000]
MLSSTEFTGSSLLKDEEIVLADYVAGQRLGEGTYASVFAVTYVPSGQRFAMKRIPTSYLMVSESQIIQEATAMQSMEHPHVVKLHKFLQSTSAFYLLLDLASGGELFDLIISERYFRESTARLYFQQLMSAIDYCHSKGVAHRDLKAENLLLGKDNQLLVCDFGFCSTYHVGDVDENDNTANDLLLPIGTLHYTSPEAAARGATRASVDAFQQDLWSAGVILFFMLTGRLPFSGRDDEETLYLIQKGTFSFTDDEKGRISDGAQSLVCAMLALEPTERPGITQIVEDDWFIVDLEAGVFPHRPSLKSSLVFLDFSTQHRATEQEEAVIKKAFRKIDIDGHGMINRDQIRDMLTTLRGAGVVAEEVTELIELFTGNAGSDSITYEEFRDAWVNKDLAHSSFKRNRDFQLPKIIDTEVDNVDRKTVRQVRGAFDRVDKLHTGIIDAERLKQHFEECNSPANEEEIQSIIRFFDERGVGQRGEITFHMFLKGVVKREMLVRHPLGWKLAEVTSLTKFLQLRKLRESLRRGILVCGLWTDVVKKLMTQKDRLVPFCEGRKLSDVEHVFSFCYTGSVGLQTVPLAMSVTPPQFDPEGNPSPLHYNVPPSMLCNSLDESPCRLFSWGANPSLNAVGSNDCRHDGDYIIGSGDGARGAANLMGDSTSSKRCTYSFGCSVNATCLASGTCVVDVILSPGCSGYTFLRFCRISGRTHDFHEAVGYISGLFEMERQQAMEDSLPRGESVLI